MEHSKSMTDSEVTHRDFENSLRQLILKDDAVNAKRLSASIDEQDKKKIVAKGQNDYSPLCLAAENNSIAMVEFLVKDCKANIEEVGEFHLTHIQSVTPLWCAAGKNNFEVVKLLLNFGADINAASNRKMTSVNYACLKRNVDTAKFLVKLGADINRLDERGETCLINSIDSLELCQFLIENGAQVDTKNNFGNTALHHAIEYGSLKIVQLLLDHGLDQNIKNKVDDDALQLASLRGEELIVKELKIRQKPTFQRQIESLQLLGSYFFFMEEKEQALVYWKKSVELCMTNPFEELRKGKFCMTAKEVNTLEELEELCQNEEMAHMYALENLLRILSPGHKKITHSLVNVSQVFAMNGKYKRCFDLLKYAFQLQQEYTQTWTEEYSLVLDMLRIACSDALCEKKYQVELHDVFEIFDMMTSKAQFIFTLNFNWNDIPCFMQPILSFISFVLELDKSPDQMVRFEQTIHHLVHSRIRDEDGRTFLHHAVQECDTYPGVAKMLLECGADVNAVDSEHNTAMHLICCSASPYLGEYRHFGFVPQEGNDEVIKLLLQYSAHPDIVNDDGEFAATDMSLNMLDHVNLKCLATAVIRNHEIPYAGQIPESLESFVQMHGRCPSRNFKNKY